MGGLNREMDYCRSDIIAVAIWLVVALVVGCFLGRAFKRSDQFLREERP